MKFIKSLFFYYYKACRSVPLFFFKKADKKGIRDALGIPSFLLITYCIFRFFIPIGYDAFAFNVMAKEKTMTFGSAIEVEHPRDEYRVFACETFPCNNQKDSIEFRIRDSAYMDIATLFSSGNPYNPDSVAGVFLSERNKCTVKYYGRRFKYLGFYPKIIEATCAPAE